MEPGICPICGLALGPLEISVNQTTHFDCRKCASCSGPITDEILQSYLSGRATLEHSPCRNKRIEQELQERQVPVSQAHLDYLNKIRLLAWIDEDKDIAGNSQDSESCFRTLRIHEMKIDDLYKFLAKYKTLAELVSIVISEKKDKALKEASANYRERSKAENDEKRSRTRTEEIRKAQLSAERQDPKLRERRKAIEGLKKTFPGFTDEQIEAMLGGSK